MCQNALAEKEQNNINKGQNTNIRHILHHDQNMQQSIIEEKKIKDQDVPPPNTKFQDSITNNRQGNVESKQAIK